MWALDYTEPVRYSVPGTLRQKKRLVPMWKGVLTVSSTLQSEVIMLEHWHVKSWLQNYTLCSVAATEKTLLKMSSNA